MKIGLIDVDGYERQHAKKKLWGKNQYPNLALCKIAAWHKSQGDSVEWYEPMFSGHCDKVYMSKIFNFSPEYPFPIDADEIIKGGTGYDIKSCLPQEIDDMQPDLSIYPGLPKDTSYGFLTRGCSNTCKWCVVPTKEGHIAPYWDVDRVANGRTKLILMDNNILAAGDYMFEQFEKIIRGGYRIDFNQAMDARLVTPEIARLMAKIKWIDNQIRFGCDTRGQIEKCDKAIELLIENGFRGKFMLYTMLQGDLNECFSRINHYRTMLINYRREHIGRPVYPNAQPYLDPNDPRYTAPQWQKDMAHWVNNRALFCTTEFANFEPRKGFKCKRYFKTLSIN